MFKNILHKNYWFLFFLGIILLTFLSLSKALSFEFWRDDWGDTWGVLYHGKEFLTTWAAARLHPGSGYEKYFLTQFFQTNPYPWQITGLVLRILSSLSVALMAYGIAGSKKIAVIAGFLFAPLLMGLESYVWVSAHTSGIFIIFFCVGVYFWVVSQKNKNIFVTCIALLVLLVSFAVSPARGIVMLALLPLWDTLSFVVSPSKKLLMYSVLRNIIFFILAFSLLHILNSSGTFTFSSLSQKIADALINTNLIRNFLASIGNGTIGWLIPLPESGSLANPDQTSVIGGTFLIIFILFSALGFMIKRNKFFQILFFSSIWMIFFYVPNWFFDQGLTVGSSHRYLTISSVSLVIICAYLFGLIKQKWYILLVAFFILLNILSCRRVLAEQSLYRSISVVDPIWNTINKTVPQGEKGDIFMYEGFDNLRGTVLDWSFSIPFVLKRKLASQEDTPIATGDRKLIQQLLCMDNVSRPAIGTWIVQNKRIPLSHLYAWDITNRVMTDVSQKERISFAKAKNLSEPDCTGVTSLQ